MIKTASGLFEKIKLIQESLPFLMPELVIGAGILLTILTGLFFRRGSARETQTLSYVIAFAILTFSFLYHILAWSSFTIPAKLFNGMLGKDNFSTYFKILFDVSGILTLLMSRSKDTIKKHRSEYVSLILAVILGAHLLVMSTNLVMVFLSLELISISSYVLAGFAFKKESTEGSLKYFLFGSVSSAIMLYGFSLLYGLTGTLNFASGLFADQLLQHQTHLMLIAGLLSLAGFLFKVAAIPMHLWAPDIYEASEVPVVAFFSVVPKLAGVGILAKFVLAINAFGQAAFDWQFVISLVAILTITVGNFSALRQKNPKRMMAYSSIAQSGFLLIGIATLLPQGMNFMLFYATVYLIANFLIFIYLQFFETQHIFSIADFTGTGKSFAGPQVFLLTGFISLAGLPPTAGFTAKLFIFSALWESYVTSGKSFLLWLLIIGLLNTVVSLFYYLRIPFLAFLRGGNFETRNNLTFKNLFGLILVLLILFLFFQPNILMSWINKINFVL